MGRQRRAFVFQHRLTGKVDPHHCPAFDGRQAEGKHLTGDGLGFVAKLCVNGAAAILHPEDAGTIVALFEKARAPKLDDRRLAEFLGPPLCIESLNVIIAQLDREVTAAITTPVAGIALLIKRWLENGESE